jgi:tetratricopeptide (TPR) repeat protein
MRFRSPVIFALTTVFALAGCAAGGAGGGGGPSVSPTGRVYEPGIEPRQTEFSRAATQALARAQLGGDEAAARAQYEAAMAQARLGIAADSTNPMHYYVAGEAAVGLGDYALADSMWIAAERFYPAYELEIEPSRESAWANAFNEGVEAYNAGDMAGARRTWEQADRIYRFRPEAAQNLAILLTNEGEYDAAIDMYQRGIESIDMRPATRIIEDEEMAERELTRIDMQKNLAQLLLFRNRFADAEPVLRALVANEPTDIESQANLATVLTRLDRADEARQIYDRLLNSPNLPASELFTIGVALFQAEDFVAAADAFRRVTQLQPDHRDAWFNQANALLAAEAWDQVIPVGQQLIVIDPLNSMASLILVQAYRELDRSTEGLQILQNLETKPVFLDALQIQPGSQRTVLSGEVIGNAAAPGTPVQLRFTFFDDNGQVGTQTISVNAPAREQRQSFEVTVSGNANSYKYEVL